MTDSTTGAGIPMRSLPTPPPSIPSSSATLGKAAEASVAADAGASQPPPLLATPASYPATPSSSESTAPTAMSPNHETVGDPDAPARKRLKLDSPPAHRSGRERRLRLLEHRQNRLKRKCMTYRQNAEELLYLNDPNGADLAAFRRKLPNTQYLEFLKDLEAPEVVLNQVESDVCGPAFERLQPSVEEDPPLFKGPVTSAAMASAIAALQQRQQRDSEPVIKPVYSPRMNASSPVKYGHQMLPFPAQLNINPQLPGTRMSSLSREQLADKIRQEPFVLRRVADLSRDGLWSDKRLPKVCERPRPKSHWDGLLGEMTWLAVDFHQERKWKKAAAKMLAESARDFVKTWEVKKKLKREAAERHRRCVARFVSEQVLNFWQNVSTFSEDPKVEDDEDEEDELFEEPMSEEESTIEEQEAYEAEHTLVDHRLELDTLTADNQTTLDQLIRVNYPGYVEDNDSSGMEDCCTTDEEESLSSEEEEDVREKVLNLWLSNRQRKLYDDFMAGPEFCTAMESGDAHPISSVLNTLRKICNHPRLVQTVQDDDDVICTDVVFPPSVARIADQYCQPHIQVAKVISVKYDPFERIDLSSLNLVYFAHEFNLTAITSDRIRKCCAPKTLLQDLSSQQPKQVPAVPAFRLKLEIRPTAGAGGKQQLVQTINGQHMFLTASAIDVKADVKTEPKADSHAFHSESLHVIAKFNGRKCRAMPLYGKDLVDALTVVHSAKPVKPHLLRAGRRFGGGAGYVNALRHAHQNRFTTHALSSLIRTVANSCQIHSDWLYTNTRFPAKVLLKQGFNPALESEFERYVSPTLDHVSSVFSLPRLPLDAKPLVPSSLGPYALREASSKLTQLDVLLQGFRRRGQKALVFSEMPEMLALLQVFLHRHKYPFVYLSADLSDEEKTDVVDTFSTRPLMLVMLASTSARPTSVPDISNVVFFDSNWNQNLARNCTDNVPPCVEWCHQLRKRLDSELVIYRLVCQGTVEDSISSKVVQTKLLGDLRRDAASSPENGSRVWKIKRQTLEDLFFNSIGDNGIFNADLKNDTFEVLNDVEAMAQLDWLWSSKLREKSISSVDVVELARTELDNPGCEMRNDTIPTKPRKSLTETLKPIEKYALSMLQRLEKESRKAAAEPFLNELDDLNPNPTIEKLHPLNVDQQKLDWELRYQIDLQDLAYELEQLERIRLVCYSKEDASRPWQSEDGQAMPLWTPPMPPTAGYLTPLNEQQADLAPDHLASIYNTLTIMDESELPGIYAKKDLKRSAVEAFSPSMDKSKEDFAGATYAPRSLFDRPVNQNKMRLKNQQRVQLPNRHPNLPTSVAGLRHPLPRPQVEAENAPDWLISEDWALLRAVREILELPLSLQITSPAHIANWDMVADMVNAVSHVYRGPRQCRSRYESILIPREEGRILLYDMSAAGASQAAAAAMAAASGKKNKKSKTSTKLPTKPNRPVKTSTMFKQDNNNGWSGLFTGRFSNVKTVRTKHPPTTKPLMVNPIPKNNPKHAQHLAEAGINYDQPLSPVTVAANRAERISKEQRDRAQDQRQLAQQRVAHQQAAQAVAQAAQQQTTSTAAVASNVVQAALSAAQPHPVAQQQAVVVGIPTSQPQQRLQTSQAPLAVQELLRASPQQQPTVVVSSQQPSVVTVANLTPQIQQKLVNVAAGGPKPPVSVSSPSFVHSNVVLGKQQQQLNLLRQTALMKKPQEVAKARLQSLQPTAAPQATNATHKVVNTVSLPVTSAVTVVTQAMASGQPKAHLIRQANPAGCKVRINDSEMKILLAKQQLQQNAAATTTKTHVQIPAGAAQNNIAQLLAQGNIQVHSGAGGTQVATIVKTSGAAATTQSPQQLNAAISPQVRAALARNPTQMQYIQRQILQRAPTATFAAAKTGTNATANLQQKIALTPKGLPAQLIVSSGGNAANPNQKATLQPSVTVHQFQQIVKSVQANAGATNQGTAVQQIPHAVLAKQQTPGAVQARVIPVSSGTGNNRTQQIRVVAATPSQALLAASQARQAPNVTVDASGRPAAANTANIANALASQIRIQGQHGQQQLLNQVSAIVGGQPVSVAVRGPILAQQGQQAKLQVVGTSTTQQQATTSTSSAGDQAKS